MAMHGFTVLVLLALLAAPAPAARAPVVRDEASSEDRTRLRDGDRAGARLQNSTAAGPKGWAHRKVREAWGQGNLPGRVLQSAAGRVSAGVSMLQDSERLGANLSGHATRIAASSGISVLQHGARRFGHLLGAPSGGAPEGAAVNTTGGLEKDIEMEVEKDLGASSEQVHGAEKSAEEALIFGRGSQILFALLYFFFIAREYPKLPENAQISQEVSEFQEKSVLTAPCDCSPNVFLACCCPVPRAAHTMDAAGILDYWPSCLLMTFCPCPTLWLVHSRSGLRGKLGAAAPRGCFTDCLCVTFCTWCVLSQDAIALDMIIGARTGICGVTPPTPAAAGGPEPEAPPLAAAGGPESEAAQ